VLGLLYSGALLVVMAGRGVVRGGVMCLLDVSVAAGEAGSVVTLAGEADLTTVAALREALSAQIDGGARHLTVDLSRLRFADSMALHALAVAGRAIEEAGGKLELLRPQPPVARVLELLCLDQVLTVRGGTDAAQDGALPPDGRCLLPGRCI
jgi:anti-sigma B factor antagonist